MARIAPRVHTAPATIERLEALARQLPQGECVEIGLEGGGQVRGIVAATPSIQDFLDAAGGEGMNALVRIETPREPAPAGVVAADVRDLWLDRVASVRRLPNPTPPEDGRPSDPNAQHSGERRPL